MLYLRHTTETQVFPLPKSMGTAARFLKFKAKSTIDLAIEINEDTVDLGASDLYYKLIVTLSDSIPIGEYEYSLSVGDTLLSSGLLVIGDYAKPSEFNKEITYEQYETE